MPNSSYQTINQIYIGHFFNEFSANSFNTNYSFALGVLKIWGNASINSIHQYNSKKGLLHNA